LTILQFSKLAQNMQEFKHCFTPLCSGRPALFKD